PRTEAERARMLRASNREVAVALGLAGLVNMAMVLMAAAAFHAGRSDIGEIATAYESLTPLLGAAAAGTFLFALLASGMSSSVVGTMAGQIIMQGFVGFSIPVWLRRLATMSPAFIVVACGADRGARAEPGGAQRRPAVSDDRPRLLHRAGRYPGPLRQSPRDANRGDRGNHPRADA